VAHVRIVQRKAAEIVGELRPEEAPEALCWLSVDSLLQVYKGRLPGQA